MTIGRTLQSASSQTGEFELEHVIQDGGSSDGTLALVEEYARTAKCRVSLASERDEGFYDGINKALGRVTGQIIGLINADDWLADEHVLQDVVRKFRDASSPEAIYADLDYVSSLSHTSKSPSVATGDQTTESRRFVPHRVVRHWVAGRYSDSGFKNGWMPPHPTVYVRREVYQRLGGYRLDMGTAADYEWMVRVFEKHRLRTAYIPRVTVKMLNGGQSNGTVLARLLANRHDRRAWEINGLKPGRWFSLAKPSRKLHQFFRT